MTALFSVLICGGLILYTQVLRRATDWLYYQPWWDRVRPALLVAEGALGATGLALALFGGSLAVEAVGVSCALAGLLALAFTAVEPVV